MTTTITVDPGEHLKPQLTYDTVHRTDADGRPAWVSTDDDDTFFQWLVHLEWIEGQDVPHAYGVAQVFETNGGWFLLGHFHGEHRTWQNVYAVGETRDEAIENYLIGDEQ